MVRTAFPTGLFADLFGTCRFRVEAPNRTRIRIDTHRGHENIVGSVHGGFLAACADQALFIGSGALGIPVLLGVTIDLTCQFMAPPAVGRPLDIILEVLRETGRLVFARGLIEADGAVAVSFTGTLRKPR